MSRFPFVAVLTLLLAACSASDAPGTQATSGGSLSAQAVGADTSVLRSAVNAPGIQQHLAAFQGIASANGGTRAASTPGYDASVAYVQQKLTAAGYQVSLQTFTYPVFVDLSTLAQTAPVARTFTPGSEFVSIQYSPEGSATAAVQGVDLVLPPSPTPTSSSACEAADFAGFVPGRIALIQRGTCTFEIKILNAQAAGASAVIIFNEGQPGRTDIDLTPVVSEVNALTIPAVFTSFAAGSTLNGATVTVNVDTEEQTRTSQNVIAQSVAGRSDRVVVVGAHLDSVDGGPGINDNGSGSAAILEIALQMANLGIQPRNQVRFAFWGAEELGLIGSERYVASLSTRQKKDIALNLNFDMVGSPNYARFVYDGDGNATPEGAGPNGSGTIENVLTSYFAAQGLASLPTAFSGRSDYGPFIAAGIPAGGLFTGAEGIKSAAEAQVFGGTAGVAYDPCYHEACDTLANVNAQALDEMGDAAAHAVLTFAQTTSAVNGTGQASGTAAANMSFRGNNAVR